MLNISPPREDSLTNIALTFNCVLPTVNISPIFACKLSAICGAIHTSPFAGPCASRFVVVPVRISKSPRNGKAASTALISTNCVLSPSTNILGNSAVSLKLSCCLNASARYFVGKGCILVIAKSPPSNKPPCCNKV